MKRYKYLYLSPSMARRRARIYGLLKVNRLPLTCVVITLAQTSQDQLDLYERKEAIRAIKAGVLPMVVALCRDMDEAYAMILTIQAEAADSGLSGQLRAFIEMRQTT